MKKASDTISNNDDQFGLSRFISAQKDIYNRILAELKRGQKLTHWMWFVFPQLDGLGRSTTAKRYAIKSREEAQAYLNHPLLGTRLFECTEAVFVTEGKSVAEIFGYPDDLKLKSSMTLFSDIAEPDSLFVGVLDKYFQGERDLKTLQLLEKLKQKNE